MLAEAGATELYCGLVPPDWRGRFQSISANRRPSGNLASYADLAEAVRSAHAHAAALSLVLNAQHYAAAQIEAAEEIAGRFADLGGDALIVSDLGLVERLATRFPALRVHVSSVATCRNAAAARLQSPRNAWAYGSAHSAGMSRRRPARCIQLASSPTNQ